MASPEHTFPRPIPDKIVYGPARAYDRALRKLSGSALFIECSRLEQLRRNHFTTLCVELQALQIIDGYDPANFAGVLEASNGDLHYIYSDDLMLLFSEQINVAALVGINKDFRQTFWTRREKALRDPTVIRLTAKFQAVTAAYKVVH